MDAKPAGEEDDEVVGEVDIFLAQPEKSSDLYVLQYPLRNVQIGIGKDRKVTGVNVRPKHGRIEVKLAVLPENPDPEDISNGEGCGKSFDMTQDLAEEKSIGEEQCLRSKPSLAPPDSNYALASFLPAERSLDGAPSFTIVPVRSVAQLRPTFDYLDAHDAKVAKHKAEEKAARAVARGLDTKQQQQPLDDKQVSQLQVSFRRRETERTAERRRNSHASLRMREESEPWIPVRFIPEHDDDAVRRRNALFANTRPVATTALKEEDVFDAETTYTDLFRSHTRHIQLGLVAKANTHAQQISARALKSLPTEAAVSQVISQARIVTFRDLHQLVGTESRSNDVLNATRIVAMCLRGCWVAKKSNQKSLRKLKLATERFDASRVLIFNIFRRKRTISEAEAIEALGDRVLVTEDSVQAILKEVADRKRGVGWEFRLEDDDGFAAEYPDLCATQNGDWEQRVMSAREVLSKVKR